MKILSLAIFTVAFVISCAAACSGGESDFESKVRESVARQMADYPVSTMKDLYKSFFQDRFGPGHMVAETAAACEYLAVELDSYDMSEAPKTFVESVGWQHNYLRIDLDAVKLGLIAPGTLLDTFVRSANGAQEVSLDKWRDEWTRIEAVIKEMNLSLPDCETDLNEIRERLAQGRYMGHHSRAYNDAYAPHYRIVSREIYENELKPLLERDE